MVCRAYGISRNRTVTHMGYRAIELSRRWDIAKKKGRANGVNPEKPRQIH